jgi:hypothetical protein
MKTLLIVIGIVILLAITIIWDAIDEKSKNKKLEEEKLKNKSFEDKLFEEKNKIVEKFVNYNFKKPKKEKIK